MNAGIPTVSLKIDVDTLVGYLEGVPRLAKILDALGVPATFCIAMGPDRSGLAVRRVFTKRGFLSKALRTRAAATYGLRTMLFGTLLPAPLIVQGRPEIFRQLLLSPHEVIPHGWDHVNWHDYLVHWDLDRTRRELKLATEAYERLAGKPCTAFASPGWQWTRNSALVEEELGLTYAADTRGWAPFFADLGERPGKVLQIPTTLPTLDEIIGRPDIPAKDLLDYLLGLFRRPPYLGAQSFVPPSRLHHVFTAHAEIEGRRWLTLFEDLVGTLMAEGFRFVTLKELADEILVAGGIPVCRVVYADLPGRAGKVACQLAPSGRA
ncbi:MAG: polysaccharide deacetylase family protein [Armatimonadetes bacterium]|nr:polysaccharide deacetylase family protein [Armatimonadota bacterium]